ARRAGQAWVDSIAFTKPERFEWQGAHLTAPQAFHNPRGEVIAYMFAIENNGKTVGRVLVGSSAYGFPIFEAADRPPFSIPPAGEATTLLRKEHGLQIAQETLGQPKLLLLNILRGFYAVWEVEGRVAGINLATGCSFVEPDLRMLPTAMPCPVEYRAARAGSKQSLLMSPYWEPHVKKTWRTIRDADRMVAWGNELLGAGVRKVWCGPASGVSIGMWQREVEGNWRLDADPLKMFEGLQREMRTLSFPYGWTLPWHYGPGFVSYAADRGEEHFTYSRYSGRRIWWDVIRAITANDPLGLCGWMDIDGKDKAHWVAVKGWHWSTAHGRRVLVTDSYCESDNRELCWDALNAPPLHLVPLLGSHSLWELIHLQSRL
ncbi:hypothetical protein M1O20_06860, partial [Dehalococcoidia bacterium]|nr:hypothetical protein [Dehalococcoidia bacterium]